MTNDSRFTGWFAGSVGAAGLMYGLAALAQPLRRFAIQLPLDLRYVEKRWC